MASLVRMVRKSGHNGKVRLGINVSNAAHDCGCVVNGSGTMAAM